MTVLHQDVAGVTADEVSPSSDQQLGHGINEQVSVGFSLPYSTKELDTAWDPEAVVNVTVQISSLFRNSFVLQSYRLFGSSRLRFCFHYEHAAEEDVFVFCPV